MTSRITRRAALASAAATAAAVALDRGVEAADGIQVFVLDPDADAACKVGCGGCYACRAHGANKLFRAGSDVVRAHPNCNCVVTAGPVLPSSVHAQLFAASGVADRRNPAVASLLAAGVDQHELPMFGDLGPLVFLGAGAAGVGWVLRRRRLLHHD